MVSGKVSGGTVREEAVVTKGHMCIQREAERIMERKRGMG